MNAEITGTQKSNFIKKVLFNGFSSLIHWNHGIYPAFTVFHVIGHNHFPWLDESYRITVKLHLAERSVYMKLTCSFSAKWKDKSICCVSSHLFLWKAASWSLEHIQKTLSLAPSFSFIKPEFSAF